MRRYHFVWGICAAFLLYTLSYETWQLKSTFQLMQQQAYEYTSIPVASGGGINAGSGGEAEPFFPEGMNYSSFLEMHPHRVNYTADALGRNDTTNSSLLEYFPDFCGDCSWGGMTCMDRVNYLRDKYKTPNPEQAVMNDRATCRNPHMQIYWRDDGAEELQNMFSEPRLFRGNVTHSPMLGKISIYVYETLREDVGINLEEKMRAMYADPNSADANGHADIAMIDLFRNFPGRTDDPTKADLFVVPYAHASHCISKPTGVWMGACKHIPVGQMRDGVFNKLEYYNGENEKRHLFLNVINQGNSNPVIRAVPLSATIGPRYKEANIIVPYLNSLPSFQPSVIRDHKKEWWTRPRTYALTYFFGISNSKMRNSPRVWRKHFMEEVQNNWPDKLGGMPYAIRVMNRGKKPPSRFFTHMYKDSIFCPTLPGDTPPQKRFFDVILMGCIPVVLAFETEVLGEKRVSWHQPGGRAVEDSLPWIKGCNCTDPRNEIDYRSFVVEVEGGVDKVLPTIEGLMRNYTEVRRLQLALMRNAPLFAYGMGKDSHRYPDAFSKMLESARFYLDML